MLRGETTIHELSIAQNIIELVQIEAENQKATQVTKVVISVGDFSGVMIEPLQFCLELSAEQTIAANALFEVIRVPLRIHCNNCGNETELEEPLFLCSVCQGTDVEIIAGRELLVTSIELEVEEQTAEQVAD